jgi:hypothetical protein
MVVEAPPVNIESGFFYFKCPQTNEDVQSFCNRLRAYKYASLKAPIHPGHVLVVTSYMRSYHDPPSPGTRELPPLIRKGTGHVMTMPRLLLETPIRVGEELWSQVWRGTMTSADLPDVPPVPVVIKLFQESHFIDIKPAIKDFCGDFTYAEWVPGARLAANEAWAFDRMRALQGEYFTLAVLVMHGLIHGWFYRSWRAVVLWILQGMLYLLIEERSVNRCSVSFRTESGRLDMLWNSSMVPAWA